MAVTFSAISMIGLNDSATGALLPELEIYYHLPKDILSIVFLANVFGYLLSCVFSTPLEFRLGTRMTLMLSSASYVVATILMLITPPFPVVVIALSLLGFGSGLFDAVLSSVTSHYIAEGGPGYVMSFLYAAFGVGATAAPFVVGGILDGGASWQYYYVLPLAMTVVNGALIMYYFRNYTMPPDEPEYKGNGSAWQRMATVVRMRPIQIAFGLFVVAFTTTDMISAWAVTWLRDVRGIEGGMAQYYLSFFWAGIAVGRIGLSWFAHRRGWSTKYSSMCFVSIMGALVLVMFFVPNRPLTAALMALSGFFLGPCTPAVLYAIGQVVTPSQRSASVSLVISVGLAGSAISPLVYGVVAKQSGLTSLPIVIVVLCAISCLLWLIFPERRSSRRDE
ncbi:hypothetical protein CXG81DRAFT_8738 [Caulochytrium protostelioides]|uniref:Major facilitator superfamily (MFS) profile domain-containing protein n=1 Tax=Caulochytrium protostelioides TaxID=1555241 RepID=A0A4P9XEQ3_9FUNG|nr:hypothetical protein CXG81DRAFT_8738 [Caulochytrium protostelioides]|eukprot:RKP04043.1 hypothetical protein CXG81DRAFT_8738 [Caulochytrium protostelioides]